MRGLHSVPNRWLVVLEATTYTWAAAAIGEVLVCSREPSNAQKFSCLFFMQPTSYSTIIDITVT